MKLENITGIHIEEIARLYQLYCGDPGRVISARELFFRDPDTVAERWKRDVSDDYRVGSRWDPHSKIDFGAEWGGEVKVKFNPNFDPKERNTPEHAEAVQAGNLFAEAVMAYFAGLEGGGVAPSDEQPEIR